MASLQPMSTHNDTQSPPSLTPSTGSYLYLIRLSQSHETFRLPELKSLATYFNIPLQIHEYSPTSPFCIVSFPSIAKTNPDPTHNLAKKFIARSILSKGIYQLYASAATYEELHALTRKLPGDTWTSYHDVSFKFSLDAFRGKRSMKEQREIVEGFRYLPFKGRIRMSGAEEEFVVFEEWEGLSADEHAALRAGSVAGVGTGVGAGSEEGTGAAAAAANRSGALGDGDGHPAAVATSPLTSTTTYTATPNDPNLASTQLSQLPPLSRHPTRLHFTRHIHSSQRPLIEKHDLKKRPYISTTSMDAELALLTTLMAHVGPGRLVLDPFVGTGGFMVAAAELGAVTLGADIDGRSFRGKGRGMEKGVLRNFRQYGITQGFGDCVTGDLTNSPFRIGRDGKGKRWLDAVVCDPPYGVREGLKVLGRRRQNDEPGSEVTSSSMNGHTDTETQIPASTPPPAKPGPFLINGVPSHTLPGFIAPKRPYSFDAMLLDILDFAARTLVNGGRLAFWMPCANEVGTEEFGIPEDPKGLVVLRHVCVQEFNRWSRRLLVYERVEGEVEEVGGEEGRGKVTGKVNGHHADDLNQFRRMYFQGFSQASPTVGNENG